MKKNCCPEEPGSLEGFRANMAAAAAAVSGSGLPPPPCAEKAHEIGEKEACSGMRTRRSPSNFFKGSQFASQARPHGAATDPPSTHATAGAARIVAPWIKTNNQNNPQAKTPSRLLCSARNELKRRL